MNRSERAENRGVILNYTICWNQSLVYCAFARELLDTYQIRDPSCAMQCRIPWTTTSFGWVYVSTKVDKDSSCWNKPESNVSNHLLWDRRVLSVTAKNCLNAEECCACCCNWRTDGHGFVAWSPNTSRRGSAMSGRVMFRNLAGDGHEEMQIWIPAV